MSTSVSHSLQTHTSPWLLRAMHFLCYVSQKCPPTLTLDERGTPFGQWDIGRRECASCLPWTAVAAMKKHILGWGDLRAKCPPQVREPLGGGASLQETLIGGGL